jgi:hypothetical protein
MVTAPVRQVTPADEAFLWSMLFHASHSNEEDGITLDHVRNDPALARYVEGWGRPGDLGVCTSGAASSSARRGSGSPSVTDT